MKKGFRTSMNNLLASTTFFKGIVLKISINQSVIKEEKRVLKYYQKKLDNLIKEKNELNDIYNEQNTVAANLSSHIVF